MGSELVTGGGAALPSAIRGIPNQMAETRLVRMAGTSSGGLPVDGIGVGSGSLGIGLHTELAEKS